ncbi:hypothetical protein GGI02_000434 [Coemansia sp. RSA 2322]|nr:hypothetical protein GGI02_000434 [Coemansia sp. RSA 2322]
MDHGGGAPPHPMSGQAIYHELLPGGFINPFAVPPTGSGLRTAPASIEGTQQTMTSASTSIQQLTASLQTHRQNQQHQRVLHRQSFDISMLPPSQPLGLQMNPQSSHLPFRNDLFAMVPGQQQPPQAPLPSQQRQSEFAIDTGFSRMSSAMHSAGNMSAASTDLGHAGSSRTSISIHSPSQTPNKTMAAAGTGTSGPSDIALLLSGAMQLKTHTAGKPPYSYATLITYAVLHHPRKQMTLSEIYHWVMENYPYFKTAGSGWKNSIRHNLSLNKTFVRIPRPANEPGKGAYWTVDLSVLDATIQSACNKPAPMHRHSLPPRDGRLDALGAISVPTMPAGPAFMAQQLPQLPAIPLQTSAQPLNFAPEDMRQAELSAINPFLMGGASSISDMGAVQQLPGGGAHTFGLRRASLQIPPSHRYQPYHVGSLAGAAAGAGGVAQPHDMMAAATAALNTSSTLNSLNSFTTPSAEATASVADPSMQDSEEQPQAKCPASPSPSQPPSQQQASFAPTPAEIIGAKTGDCGSADSPSDAMLLSLKARLQVKPTSSLPDHLLAPRHGNPGDIDWAVSKQPSESLTDIGRDGCREANALGSRSFAQQLMGSPSLGWQAQQQHAVTAVQGSSGMASMGDISAYFTFGDAQEHPPA